MTKILGLAILFLLSACSQNKNDNGCTAQDTNSRNIIISCSTMKSQNLAKCTAAGASTALCQMGFDNGCAPLRIDPQTIKTFVKGTQTVPDSQRIVLINKDTSKELVFKEITDSNGTYLILQHFDDPGSTSSVNLPACPDLGG